MKSFLREFLAILVLAIAIFLLTQATVHSAQVNGSSMEPNLHNGQLLLINKVVYNFHEPERGDIIVFSNPYNPEGKDFIKRIIGLPGETVEIKEGTVYIHQPDGSVFALDEHEYIDNPPMQPFHGDIIPPDNYFVLGDNRNNSQDSRTGWTVPVESIIGKAWFTNWPPTEWGLAPNYSPATLTATGEMSQ